MVSLHAEVPGDGDIFELHDAIDHIERELTEELGCSAVIHMDPIETNNEIVKALKAKISEGVILLIEGASIHDFRMVQGETHTNLIFDAVVPYEVKMKDAEVIDMICKVTEQRQNQLKNINNLNLKGSTLIIVVGDKKSNNSTKLYELACRISNTDAIFVEEVTELDLMNVRLYNNIVLASGTSTPEQLIDEIIEAINSNENHVKSYLKNEDFK